MPRMQPLGGRERLVCLSHNSSLLLGLRAPGYLNKKTSNISLTSVKYFN